MYQIEKMNKKLLAAQVEEELMNYILHEPVEIGEKIPNEYELAERFGVGRSTIRETIKSLVTKGILEVRRGSGTYVISKNTFEEDPLGLAKFKDKYKLALELLEVRLMLEPEIAALASNYATKEEKEELFRLCQETEQIYRSGKNHTSKDIEFHTCIAKCSRNRVVELLQPIIQTAIATFVNLTNRQLLDETIETHQAVTRAILEGDPVGARCAMIMHLTYNRQMLMEMLEEKERRGTANPVASD
jgi:GntR family transcriptional repressor for pyruvate dehydrogenase complex